MGKRSRGEEVGEEEDYFEEFEEELEDEDSGGLEGDTEEDEAEETEGGAEEGYEGDTEGATGDDTEDSEDEDDEGEGEEGFDIGAAGLARRTVVVEPMGDAATAMEDLRGISEEIITQEESRARYQRRVTIEPYSIISGRPILVGRRFREQAFRELM